jgi:3-oxoacyl-[acyl-carrier protein] reductase
MDRRAEQIQADVADSTAVESALSRIVEQWETLDVLICNAAIFSRSEIVETSDQEFDRTFAVNVKGVFNCMKFALPIMCRQRSGRVITISSHNAKRGTGQSSKATYAATKSAVESYTRGAAIEAAPFGVTVNCVSPGWIPKDPLPPEPTDFQLKLLEGIPLGRPGRAAEIAAAVSFLASEGAGYITGETLDVNGGTWMD